MLNRPQRDRVIVALDRPRYEALQIAEKLAGTATFVKVGMSLFYEAPYVMRVLRDMDLKVFLDLKLHDIPHQVGKAVANLAHLRPELLTIHASGGSRMVEAARKAIDEADIKTKLLAVTVLTSLTTEELTASGLGAGRDIPHIVSDLAADALGAGSHGIVCSPHEVASIREAHPDALLVTPGVRPTWAHPGDDQRRIMTPREAILAGADHLVVGRPITEADDPVDAYVRIVEECDQDG